MEKEKKVPEELLDIYDEYIAATEARDSAVKGYFKFQVRNSLILAKVAVQKQNEFWRGVRELYPELGNKITFKRDQEIVCETT